MKIKTNEDFMQHTKNWNIKNGNVLDMGEMYSGGRFSSEFRQLLHKYIAAVTFRLNGS